MWLVNGFLAMLVSAGLAVAQGLQMEAPKALETERSNAIQWLITAVFVVTTLVVAFKPAKRSKLE